MKRIFVQRGMTAVLAKKYGVTLQTVRNALKYATDGDMPDMIREDAYKMGGFDYKVQRIKS